MRLSLASLSLIFLTHSGLHADDLTVGEREFLQLLGRDCPVVRLWPEGTAPDEPVAIGEEEVKHEDTVRGRTGILSIQKVSRPSMIVVSPPPEKNNGVAMVFAPGGGYGGLSCAGHIATARRLNDLGVTFVLLKYRVPKRHRGFEMNHQPVQDGQRAVGILRARAAEWGIDPGRIGIAGVSAGGNLAASLAINHAKRWYEPVDDFDRTSCRPDFAVLFKPAYLTDPIESRARQPILHCDRIDAKSTPPTLIFVNRPDKFSIGSVEFYFALRTAKVPAEIHVYPEGGHAEPLETPPFVEWEREWLRFLADQKILPTRDPGTSTRKPISLDGLTEAQDLTLGDAALRRVLGQDCPVIPVWPRGIGPDEKLEPGPETVAIKSRGGTAVNITQVTRPTLTLIQPPPGKRNGAAVIVCPGGGYSALAAEHEGVRICQWLNTQGITGLVLKYRVPSRGADFARHHHALQDVQRSIRLVRSRAAEWGLDPDRVGVCGFSAGGNLSALACTHFDDQTYPASDDVDRASARPDFGVLVYPAYLTNPIESNEVDPLLKAPGRQTPPLFMAVACDDKFTIGTLNFFLELQGGKLPAECHVYSRGGHGGGMEPEFYPASEWTTSCRRWLQGVVGTGSRQAAAP